MEQNKAVSNSQTSKQGECTCEGEFVNCRPVSVSDMGILTIDPNAVYIVTEGNQHFQFFGYQIINAISIQK